MEFMYSSKFDDVVTELGISVVPKIWRENWEPAMSAYPDNFALITRSCIDEISLIADIQGEMLNTFHKAAAMIRSSEILLRLVWLWSYILFFNNNDMAEIDVTHWMGPEASMGAHADMFHGVVLASGLMHFKNFYSSKGIPEAIMKITLSDFRKCMGEHKDMFGEYGIGTFRMPWLLNHFSGRLFRLGRLQFIHRTYEGYAIYYRNTASGRILTLCGDGIRCSNDGVPVCNESARDPDDTWTTSFYDREEFIEGHPIINMQVVKKPVKLHKNDWNRILIKGEGVLEVHIPAEGKLPYNLCLDSYQGAREFFMNYFPEKSFKAFTCYSWMLSPLLHGLLPQNSNILTFQKDYNLYPSIDKDESVIEYVFGRTTGNLHELSEKTSLQRCLKEFLINGGHSYSVNGVILE